MEDRGKQNSKRETLLEILNRHGDPAPEINYDPESFTAYFENQLGEQWLFVRKRGATTGTVYGGDLGWEGHEVRMRSWQEVRDELEAGGARSAMLDQILAMMRPDPLVPSLVLQDEEKSWLAVAWWSSSTSKERDVELQSLAGWIAEQFPAEMLEKHPNTHDYRVAVQTLALMTGRVAGARGMDEGTTMKLYAAVNELVRPKG